MKFDPPEIVKKFVCIFNREEAALAALVFSYIDQSAGYIPTFEFPFVSSEDFKSDPDKEIRDEHQLSRSRARKFNVNVGNAIRRLGGCEYLIVAGLTDKQLSYLTFLNDYNTIYIDGKDNVDVFLNGIVPKKGCLPCKESKLIENLHYALNQNLYLSIDDEAESVSTSISNSSGLIVIEQNNKVSSVFGILYAHSIGAEVELINTEGLNHYQIKDLIENWKNNEPNSFNNLSAAIYPYIEHINFNEREFATFFTDGIPYSLILKNILPISHVHLRINPDLFVFNSIYYESYSETYSAIVFSPKAFDDEETEFVVERLVENHLLVKPLVDKEATYFNLDNHIQHYPYSLLHVCSHGGEVEGKRITEKFIDSTGDEHIVVYDEVFSFGLNPFQDSHAVATKRLPREFDGLSWGSTEFKGASFPNYIFSEMFQSLGDTENQIHSIKVNVPGSCHIKCVDSIYQAMFNYLAAAHSPIIFNNTCWSWSDIADSFIGVGARGYIGTLWNIDNTVATKSAKAFYNNIFEKTVLFSLHEALDVSKNTRDENIYIFWGLHFTSIVPCISQDASRLVVFMKLMDSIQSWKTKLEETIIPEHKKTITEIIDWLSRVIALDFKKEAIKYLYNK
ncbi:MULTISPECIES: hypothetical protein [Leeuwenhoekiella]|jgi:hypothetical protein|uniref:hypothetical protein n=2 Tax=Flavobacteriaceae TaxID=49546 RepID=UPI000C4D09A1|nr:MULTISPECIES: hypothetical protein [Leeuwenhoekiella]MAO45163.1 hypothetical protein [Leeuwenhoekiella sp.]HAI19279.1 hypothetical protein [Xanthomarina gelatinilytica]HBT08593.1 hypothetical protein [Leeuwenhoekiella sp.]|tara:strand:- start:6112 stop:7974 length:1863 start_codon:yes stop_codon:yes gene_type:complete